MLKINRTKLLIAKTLYLGGLLAMIASVLLLIISQKAMFLGLLSSLVISLIGESMHSKLFLCPRCRTKLFRTGSRLGAVFCVIFNEPPERFCPDCGREIEIEIVTPMRDTG